MQGSVFRWVACPAHLRVFVSQHVPSRVLPLGVSCRCVACPARSGTSQGKISERLDGSFCHQKVETLTPFLSKRPFLIGKGTLGRMGIKTGPPNKAGFRISLQCFREGAAPRRSQSASAFLQSGCSDLVLSWPLRESQSTSPILLRFGDKLLRKGKPSAAFLGPDRLAEPRKKSRAKPRNKITLLPSLCEDFCPPVSLLFVFVPVCLCVSLYVSVSACLCVSPRM